MSQTARSAAVAAFRKPAASSDQGSAGGPRVLVATDVAARGLDVPDVSHVINFSVGLSMDNYIHRVGRCGRAGKQGIATTFVVDVSQPPPSLDAFPWCAPAASPLKVPCAIEQADKPLVGKLVELLESSRQPVPAPVLEFAAAAARQSGQRALTEDEQAVVDDRCDRTVPHRIEFALALFGLEVSVKFAALPKAHLCPCANNRKANRERQLAAQKVKKEKGGKAGTGGHR